MTDRLTPADAGFLYTEDASTPMHVGGVVILKPTVPFDYAQIVKLIEARLSLVPRYRQKVRFVPGRFARPVWIDDEDFDLTYHVRRSALPKPGSDAQLADLVGRLISRPLDRTRPLWELYVVEGLSDGRIALINKTHHSMVDRMGAVDVAAAILDISPTPRPVTPAVWLPVPAPSEIDLVVDAIADITTRPSEVIDAVRLAALDIRSTIGNVGQTMNNLWQLAHRAVRPAPRSMLNVTVSGARRFEGVSADLDGLKAIRKAHGGTINDVILTVIAGALRSFLVSRGEPVTPGTTLRAMVPMSVRQSSDGGDQGSAGSPPVESFLIDLPVSEPNPVIRLHQVSFAMKAHTESGQTVGADSLMELGRFAPATLHTLGARVGSQLGRRLYNLLITNVPGPQIPLYAAGMPVVAMYPVAPLAKGQSLAISVTSYNGRVFFGLTADRDSIPDLEDFGPLLNEAVDEFPLAGTRRATRPAESTPVTPGPLVPAGVTPGPAPAPGTPEPSMPEPVAPEPPVRGPAAPTPRTRSATPKPARAEDLSPAPVAKKPRSTTAASGTTNRKPSRSPTSTTSPATRPASPPEPPTPPTPPHLPRPRSARARPIPKPAPPRPARPTPSAPEANS